MVSQFKICLKGIEFQNKEKNRFQYFSIDWIIIYTFYCSFKILRIIRNLKWSWTSSLLYSHLDLSFLSNLFILFQNNNKFHVFNKRTYTSLERIKNINFIDNVQFSRVLCTWQIVGKNIYPLYRIYIYIETWDKLRNLIIIRFRTRKNSIIHRFYLYRNFDRLPFPRKPFANG